MKKPVRQAPSKSQAELARTHDSLFDVVLVPAEEAGDALVTTELRTQTESLVHRLFGSAAFQDQVELLARKPRERELDKFRQAVQALVDAGGTLPVTALAQRVEFPVTRADGFAAVLRQLLNYDGVQVLETLPDGRTLRLHQGLLREQFELG